MTLICTFAGPDEVVQVSDRRVSLVRSGRLAGIHSPVENKSLIFLCADAVGTMGYTGNAYVGGMPTDAWLASLVHTEIGCDGPDGDGPATFMFGSAKPLRLNMILWRIRQALAGGDLGEHGSLTVAIAGFRRRRGYRVPFVVHLCWPNTASSAFHMRLPRGPGRRSALSQVGDEMAESSFLPCFDEGARAGAERGEPPIRAGLVHVVRTRAVQAGSVGRDAMSVRILPLRRRIEWEFLPAAPHPGTLVGAGGTLPLHHLIYSPWLICPGSVQAPSVGTGMLEMRCMGWTIVCTNQDAPLPRPFLLALSSQRRARPPGFRQRP